MTKSDETQEGQKSANSPRARDFLPFALPDVGEDEISEVAAALRSGWITTGPRTKTFEKQFAEYIGCRHAIAVSSCTAALHLALAAQGIGPGDEVITSPLTFCSTANVIVHLGELHEDVHQQPHEAVVAFRLGRRVGCNLALQPELESEEHRSGDQDEEESAVEQEAEKIGKSRETT